MKNVYFLVAAYSIIWVVLFGYVLSLLNKQKTLSREIQRLKNFLQKK